MLCPREGNDKELCVLLDKHDVVKYIYCGGPVIYLEWTIVNNQKRTGWKI
jgi:hypothetical protein